MRTKEGNKEKAIIDAAISVFAGVGYFDAKIHRIADKADVATGTVYLYFGNKEKILLKIFDSVWSELFTIMERNYKRHDINSVEKFNGAIDAIFDYFTSNPSLALVFVNEQNHIASKSHHFTSYYEKTLAIIDSVFEEGVKTGLFNENVTTPIFSSFFFGGMRFLLHQWAYHKNKFALSDIRQNAKLIMLHGVAKTR